MPSRWLSTMPMASFFFDTILPSPMFSAVDWPFSSLPATWPFSTRITPKRFGAINHRIKFAPRLDQRADHRIAIAGGHGDFIGQLARERDAEQPRAQAAQTVIAPQAI